MDLLWFAKSINTTLNQNVINILTYEWVHFITVIQYEVDLPSPVVLLKKTKQYPCPNYDCGNF